MNTEERVNLARKRLEECGDMLYALYANITTEPEAGAVLHTCLYGILGETDRLWETLRDTLERVSLSIESKSDAPPG